MSNTMHAMMIILIITVIGASAMSVHFDETKKSQCKVPIDTVVRAQMSLDSLYWDTTNCDRHFASLDSMLLELRDISE